MRNFLASLILVLALPAAAQKVGGNITLHLSSDPTNLHPIMSTDVYASKIQSYLYSTLLSLNEDTYEFEPSLAEKWEISKDGLEFTFTLREGAKFHDGKPITIEDVKFSFDAIFIREFKAAHMIPYFENIKKVEILDPRRIKFTANKKYYQTLLFVGTDLKIIPQHVYHNPKAKLNRTAVGSGPYTFEKWEQGKRIILKRNPDWFGWQVPTFKGMYNFERVTFRFVKEEAVALEMLKKGDIDYMDLTPEQFHVKTSGPEWGTKLIKVKTENKSPKGYGFVGWNLRKDLFGSKIVRRALAMLINRPLMNEKFRFNMSYLQNGPIYYQSDYNPKKVQAVAYDPKKALELLKSEGWKDEDKNGVLEKTADGKKTEFRFTLLTANEDSMKYLTVIKEDAKKVGVDVEIKVLEWNAFMKLMDEGKFDAITLAWGGGTVDPDIKQVWHSSSAVPGGSNFVGYKNAKADKLIDEARETLDKPKRMKLVQEAFEIIAEEQPYAWLFSSRYTLYAHSAKLKKPKDTFVFDVGVDRWWLE